MCLIWILHSNKIQSFGVRPLEMVQSSAPLLPLCYLTHKRSRLPFLSQLTLSLLLASTPRCHAHLWLTQPFRLPFFDRISFNHLYSALSSALFHLGPSTSSGFR